MSERTSEINDEVYGIFNTVLSVRAELTIRRNANETALLKAHRDLRRDVGMLTLRNIEADHPTVSGDPDITAAEARLKHLERTKQHLEWADDELPAFAQEYNIALNELLYDKQVTVSLLPDARVQSIGLRAPGGLQSSPDWDRDPKTGLYVQGDTLAGTLTVEHPEPNHAWEVSLYDRTDGQPQVHFAVQ